jgi:hypothetical protein
MRTRTSFQKRQKEIARMEKQRDKAAKRLQRKLGGEKNPDEESDVMTAEESDRSAAEASLEAPLAAPPVSEGH